MPKALTAGVWVIALALIALTGLTAVGNLEVPEPEEEEPPSPALTEAQQAYCLLNAHEVALTLAMLRPSEFPNEEERQSGLDLARGLEALNILKASIPGIEQLELHESDAPSFTLNELTRWASAGRIWMADTSREGADDVCMAVAGAAGVAG